MADVTWRSPAMASGAAVALAAAVAVAVAAEAALEAEETEVAEAEVAAAAARVGVRTSCGNAPLSCAWATSTGQTVSATPAETRTLNEHVA
ncbi:MAG: hypothetical protein ACRYHA_29205 [Janthinobacterium lividum]